MKNPLLNFSNQPFGTIPFKDLKSDHFIPAVTEGIKNADITIDKISTSKEPPTFENTILPLLINNNKFKDSVKIATNLLTEFNLVKKISR